jgi:hypothetical protein
MEHEWQWYWGAGSEPEIYRAANSREHAVEMATQEARSCGYGEMTVCEGRPEPLTDAFFDADRVLDDFHDANDDRQDEDGGLQMEPTLVQKAELEEALAGAFRAWRERHGLGRAWSLGTRNEEVLHFAQPEPAT